jgi:phosphoribosylglycinamide formyltransferase 1
VIGVLVSGGGTNLQALLDAGLPVCAVASNVPRVRALDRASGADVPTAVFALDDYPSREERDVAMAGWLREHGAELAVCAGYMHLLRPVFLERLPTLNVHPSLLPAYPGPRAVDDALAAGETETGVTVHYVDEGIDTGPVVFQETVPVLPGDTRETLHARLRRVEHRLLPEAARLHLAGALPSRSHA